MRKHLARAGLAALIVGGAFVASTGPVIAQPRDPNTPGAIQTPARLRIEQIIGRRRHERTKGSGTGVAWNRPHGPGRVHLPDRDGEAGGATPPPLFSTPTELTPPANAVGGSDLGLISVSCTSAGNCVAVGLYDDDQGNTRPMVITETGGVWANGVDLRLPTNAATAPGAQFFSGLFSVTCTSADNCVAVGLYVDVAGSIQGMVVSRTGGVWARATELSLPANAATAAGTQNAFLNFVRCSSAGNCAATGGYVDNSGNYQGLVVSETGGLWGRGVQVTVPPNAAPNPLAGPHKSDAGTVSMGEVYCFSAGNCVAGGQYTDTDFNSQPMIITQNHGVWSPAIQLSLPANAATGQASQNGFLSGLVCFSRGNCISGGGFTDTDGNAQPLVFNQTHGRWARGAELALPGDAATAPGAQSGYLNGLECTSRGNCVAFSAYNDLSGSGQPLVITETGGVWAQGIKPPLPVNATTGHQDSNINELSCTSPGNCVVVGQYTDNNDFQQPMAYTTVPTLSITPEGLPTAMVGHGYGAKLTAAGGTGPRTWTISAGSLPIGMTLNASTGVISGVPTTSGTFSFTVKVSDIGPPVQQASAPFSITVRPRRDHGT